MIFAGLGGLLRALVGLSKSLKRKEQFSLPYFSLTVFIACAIGLILTIYVTEILLAFVIGYAGTDLLEGIRKTIGGSSK